MHNVLKTLHTEHAHICRVLDFLDTQIDLLEKGGNPEWDLMRDVMHYMTNFPDIYHHPKEDLVFNRLRQRQSGAIPEIDDILHEHGELSKMGQKFRAAIQEVEGGSVMSTEDFSKMALCRRAAAPCGTGRESPVSASQKIPEAGRLDRGRQGHRVAA